MFSIHVTKLTMSFNRFHVLHTCHKADNEFQPVSCSPYMSQSWRWVSTGFMFSIHVTKLTMSFNQFHVVHTCHKADDEFQPVSCSPYMSQSWRWVSTGFMFSIYVTKLTMSFNRFHVLRIQETDYRQHFICGGILYFLKHYKHKTRCVNTVRMSVNCVCALLHNQQTWHARAPSWSQCLFSG